MDRDISALLNYVDTLNILVKHFHIEKFLMRVDQQKPEKLLFIQKVQLQNA